MSSCVRRSSLFALLLVCCLAAPAVGQRDFVTFESGPVRPLALSPDGTRLFATNTPDGHLEIFDVTSAGLVHAATVAVGLEPVAVAARSNSEVWVVNHLSDSISIVDVAASPPRVTRTLLVGDEPRDLVFAGTAGNRAFITTAHRGQHRSHASISGVPGAGDPQLTTASVGRADVWVFDATNLGTAVGGTPVRILTFFADTPRALAVGDGGNTVYAAAFHSGNQTTSIIETSVCDGFTGAGPCSAGGATAPGGLPGPSNNVFGNAAPETGLIVKFDGSAWRDVLGRSWSNHVRFNLPDRDVFSIDANTLSSGSQKQFSGVGTILFNMVVNPVSGKVYVTNTDSPNLTRFEGPGVHGGSTVQGHLSETRITVIDPVAQTVDPQHLNQHIDYSRLHTDVPDIVDVTQKAHSLATPLQAVVSSDGSKLYMAAFGSAKIGVFDTAAIEDASFESNFDPTLASAGYIATGGGPAGLVLDEARGRLYVLTRFDNSVASINLTTRLTLETLPLHNPEPPQVVTGRPFLYDAVATSGNGEASCASCHIFADFDSIAWDLGNPDDSISSNTQPAVIGGTATFHPMKGPMTTQTLRGLATHGGMHWRGDRVDGFFGTDSCASNPNGSFCNEQLSFDNFIVAFEGLVGMQGTITPTEMHEFTAFALEIMLPPNPVRALDNSLTATQQTGASLYTQAGTDAGVLSCIQCHALDPSKGFFGTQGFQSFEGEVQNFKIAGLRNAYQKLGMFGNSSGGSHRGDQVRGFGFLHDGSVDTLRSFLQAAVFNLNATQEGQLEQFVLAFDSDLAPIVGQQVTLSASNSAVANPRIDLLIARSGTNFTSLMLGGVVKECDLIVKGSVGGQPRGWLRQPGNAPVSYMDDTGAIIGDAALRALATSEGPLTFTCATPGSGLRVGLDRDLDTVLDGIDNCDALDNLDQIDTDGDGEGNACDRDDDNDGLLDVVETQGGIYVSPTNTGTNPLFFDSDGDGYGDGDEVAAGSDPTNALSIPGGAPVVPLLPPAGLGLLGLVLAAVGANAARRRIA